MEDFDSVVQIVHEPDGWASPGPSVAVLDALSDIEDVSPLELDFVLYDYVDPESLDSLVTDRRGSRVVIQFSVRGYHVRIDADTITITSETDR